jgi:hypothetical protein
MGYCVDKPLVYKPDTRVAWQDARGPVITYTCPTPFLHLPAKPTESKFGCLTLVPVMCYNM